MRIIFLTCTEEQWNITTKMSLILEHSGEMLLPNGLFSFLTYFMPEIKFASRIQRNLVGWQWHVEKYLFCNVWLDVVIQETD